MKVPERDIEITVFYDGEWHTVKTYANEYRNLMMLLYDKICTDEFGECLGMGKCGTCVIEVSNGHTELTSYNRNEETTIAKAGLGSEKLRLSCQILIDSRINGLVITIR